jgi:hypothetical protein
MWNLDLKIMNDQYKMGTRGMGLVGEGEQKERMKGVERCLKYFMHMTCSHWCWLTLWQTLLTM